MIRPALGIDTSGPDCGAALAGPEGLIAQDYLDRSGRTGERIAGLVGSLLEQADIKAGDLCGLGVATGPGSYTGLRVGLALVRGLAVGSGLDAVGFGSLQLTALTATGPSDRVCATMDAGRDRLYAAGYQRDGENLSVIFEAEIIEAGDLDSRLASEGGHWQVCCQTKRAGVLALAASSALARGQGGPAAAILPVYVGQIAARPNQGRVAVRPPEAG
ncbi:MAG: tRNA (adenosine(37)-N6)-threonylcarbamoyltransferase complex dimerization subunit type 1 TsaB [Deltaproteobacteria bacterium]